MKQTSLSVRALVLLALTGIESAGAQSAPAAAPATPPEGPATPPARDAYASSETTAPAPEQLTPDDAPAALAAEATGGQTPAGIRDAGAGGEKVPAEISGAPGKGLTIKAGDGFSLNLRSRFQLRYQLDISAEEEAGERNLEQLVNIGTARLWLSGNVFRREILYLLQLAVAGRDYRDGATSPLFDAYIDWKAHRDFNVRVGQFFVPFDRLRTVREFALQMADRPVPIGELTLARDAGVVVYSDEFLSPDSPLAWRAGMFGGGGTNLSRGRDPGLLLTARLELRPLGAIDDDSEGDLQRRETPGLALGVAIANNRNTNRQLSTTGITFAGGNTDYLHAAADLVFKWQGFAVQLEYLWRNASRDTISSTGVDGSIVTEWTRSGSGWITQASYTFDPPFEIVGRVSRLHAFDGTDPRLVDTDELGAGVNYYLNGHQLKVQADWIAKAPAVLQLEDAAHVAHLQLDVTF